VGLIEALHLSKPSLFGYSLGGFVAQRIAVTDPQLLSAAILAGTSPGGAHETLPNLRLNAPLLNPLTPADQLFPRYFSGHVAAMTAWHQRVDQRHSRVAVSLAGLNRERAALGGWLTNPRSNVASRLSTISIPILVLGAALDQQEPVANSQYLASVIPGARLILYPGLSHAFPFEAPQRVASDITAFLDSKAPQH
jgi:pimeloyl-ACP methyl ester carboxylesterase